MGRESADAADQECRSVRFMVVEIDISRVADADQKFPAAGLLFRDDPCRRSPNLQDLAAAVGGENGNSRVGQGANP
jgi:hypothetical protein